MKTNLPSLLVSISEFEAMTQAAAVAPSAFQPEPVIDPNANIAPPATGAFIAVNTNDAGRIISGNQGLLVPSVLKFDQAREEPRIPVDMNPAREICGVSPAARRNHIPLHIYVSDDLQTITYAMVHDDSSVFASGDGRADYSQIRETKVLSVPSGGLITPAKYLNSALAPNVRDSLNAILSLGRRYTTYGGVTTSWDVSIDRDVWTTNIDTGFFCDVLKKLGVFDDRSFKKLLELGVGGGHNSATAAAKMPNLREICVTDISTHALSTAKRSMLPYLKPNVIDRYFLGAGLISINEFFDVIFINPPYIPARRGDRNDKDPYRGTGLIREIMETGIQKLNPNNPNARIFINISSLARKDLAEYLATAGNSIRFEEVGAPMDVPLKIVSIDEEWREWLVSEGLLEYRPSADASQENYWHTLQMYSISRP